MKTCFIDFTVFVRYVFVFIVVLVIG